MFPAEEIREGEKKSLVCIARRGKARTDKIDNHHRHYTIRPTTGPTHQEGKRAEPVWSHQVGVHISTSQAHYDDYTPSRHLSPVAGEQPWNSISRPVRHRQNEHIQNTTTADGVVDSHLLCSLRERCCQHLPNNKACMGSRLQFVKYPPSDHRPSVPLSALTPHTSDDIYSTCLTIPLLSLTDIGLLACD
jgi:hypothetical protein